MSLSGSSPGPASSDLSPASQPLTVVQITDSHLGDSPHSRLLNLDTDASLAAVLRLVRREQPRIDALLATGDLADSGSADAYARFLTASEALGGDESGSRCRWLPGNHDDWSGIRAVLTPGDVRLRRQLLLGEWQIITLDSTIPGEVGGNLTLSELSALRDCLDAEPDRYALVCLHHHVLPVGADWLDVQRVANGEHLLRELARFPQIRVLLSGHVHQSFDTMHDDIRVLTSPSTCVQFMPGSPEFQVDAAATPGYRWLRLYRDGRVDSGVSRIGDAVFQVDGDASGY